MWRLDVTDYDVIVSVEGRPTPKPYNVKRSYGAILFNPALQLTAQQAFEAKDLTDRIKRAETSLLVDRQDKARLQAAYEAVRSPTMDDLELLRRIRDIPKVEVEETAAQNGDGHGTDPAEARVLASTLTRA
jgi:hypothetical protein